MAQNLLNNVWITLDLENQTVSIPGANWELKLFGPHRAQFLTGTWNTTATLLKNRDARAATARRLPTVSGYGQQT